MSKALLMAFWNCGDNDIIEFALLKARLNKHEKDVVVLMLDECKTQEETAEILNYSTRRVQEFWCSASKKLMGIPWLVAYAHELLLEK